MIINPIYNRVAEYDKYEKEFDSSHGFVDKLTGDPKRQAYD